MARPVSILEPQIGYHPRDVKRVYLRSIHETPVDDPTGKPFEVVDVETGRAAYAGAVSRWGRKWLTWWWVLDLTPVRRTGRYVVRVGSLESSPFRIAPAVLADEQLEVVAIDQLEERIDLGPDDKQVTALKGHYTVGGVRIYRDCGSHYAELPPVGTVVHGLADLRDHLWGRFSEPDRRRIIDMIVLGADYITAAQVSTDDPNTDGRFRHSILVNDPHPWAGDVFSYHDMAFAMAALARAARVVRPFNAQKAEQYLAAAVKAWRCATHRPRHLPEEFDLPAGCPDGDRRTVPFWTPQGFNHTFARCIYNIRDGGWRMPLTLRTRDRLPFIWAATLLYEITGEKRFLDSAVEFARAVAGRQFTDWENPIEGAFGNFYEFEESDDAFGVEFCQGGHWWMGNIESINLAGFINLLRLAPDHEDAATWHNVIRTYGENYVKPTAALSPLGVYPVACYRDEECGGIKFFQNVICGCTCLYGFAARTIMDLAAALNDCSYQALANANAEFVAGLNPGIPNAYDATAWDAQSLINGVGAKWFGGEHGLGKIPKGAVCNGFCASEQFWIDSDFELPLAKYPDAPKGIIKPDGKRHFNEDWIAHSHAYVSAVAKLEGPFVLKLAATSDSRPVEADVRIDLRAAAPPHEQQAFAHRTGKDGKLTLAGLPTQMAGQITASHEGVTASRHLETVSSGEFLWRVDFARCVKVAVEAPEKLAVGESGAATIRVANVGSAGVAARVSVSGAGVDVGWRLEEVRVAPGGCADLDLPVTAGRRVSPYLIYARAAVGDIVADATGGGLIASK